VAGSDTPRQFSRRKGDAHHSYWDLDSWSAVDVIEGRTTSGGAFVNLALWSLVLIVLLSVLG
jgi:hypothetical protein